MEDFILMSIKTKYANQIFAGIKKYEYRRRSLGDKNIGKKIFIYSSEEEKAIVGYIVVEDIIKGDINFILDSTNYNGDDSIIDYFNNCDVCYALKIKNAVRFDFSISLSEIRKRDDNFVIPQYYRYIKENEYIYNILIEKIK